MNMLREGFAEAWRLVSTGDAVVFHALGVSLLCSTLAVLLAALVAVPYGAWLGLQRPRGRSAHLFLLRLGLSVPTVVIGLFVYMLLTRRGLLGDLHLLHTLAAIVVGQTLLAFPLLASLVHGATAALDPVVLESARTLGAGRIGAVRMALGEVRPALATAFLAAFGRCVTELGIVLMVGGGLKLETLTLTQAIQLEISRGEFGLALAPALLLLVVAALVTLLSMRLERGGRR